MTQLSKVLIIEMLEFNDNKIVGNSGGRWNKKLFKSRKPLVLKYPLTFSRLALIDIKIEILKNNLFSLRCLI